MGKYLLEIIFERPTLGDNGQQFLSLETTLFSFEHPEKETAYDDAHKELVRISQEGLDLHGGAVIKSIIMPNCIKQIGIIDYDAYEASAIESEASPVPPEVPMLAETAPGV